MVKTSSTKRYAILWTASSVSSASIFPPLALCASLITRFVARSAVDVLALLMGLCLTLLMGLCLALCSFCWIEKRTKEKECSRVRVVRASQRVREGTNFELTLAAFAFTHGACTALASFKCFCVQKFTPSMLFHIDLPGLSHSSKPHIV